MFNFSTPMSELSREHKVIRHGQIKNAVGELIRVIDRTNQDPYRRQLMKIRTLEQYPPRPTPKDALVEFNPHSKGALYSRRKR